MKNAVLAVGTHKYINIGDYVQGLASAQFFDRIDLYIERERLNTYDGDLCRMIMNGWYMHYPENWPPTDKIKPLMVSFHISPFAKEAMLSKRSIAYFMQHQPIGCRDHQTMDMLIEKGVDAYFSACMTTTLGKKYYNPKTTDKIYIVDPICTLKISFTNIFRIFFGLLFNLRTISVLLKKNIWLYNSRLNNLLLTTVFYIEYRKILSKEDLLKAEYITHILPNKGDSSKDLMEYAKQLIRKYAEAKFVVTSRIHCALPCLSLQTPVLYIEHKQQSCSSRSRLGGLQDMFNVVVWNREKMKLTVDPAIKAKIGVDLKNKDTWKKYSERLIDSCNKFINDTH